MPDSQKAWPQAPWTGVTPDEEAASIRAATRAADARKAADTRAAASQKTADRIDALRKETAAARKEAAERSAAAQKEAAARRRKAEQKRKAAQGTPFLDSAARLVRDMFFVFVDIINWLWDKLWKLNRAAAKTLLPGQARGVQTLVALLAVCAEVVGLWLVLVDLAARTHS